MMKKNYMMMFGISIQNMNLSPRSIAYRKQPYVREFPGYIIKYGSTLKNFYSFENIF